MDRVPASRPERDGMKYMGVSEDWGYLTLGFL